MSEVLVQESFARCLSTGKLLDRFYEIFLESHPDIKPMFAKTDFAKQKGLLRNGLNTMISYSRGTGIAESALKRLGRMHGPSQLDIAPGLFKYWIDSILATVEELDPEFDDETAEAWRTAMQKGTDFMIAHYE